MKISKTTSAIIIGIVLIIIVGVMFSQQDTSISETSDEKSAIYSPYAGQEARGIKALSQDDIEGLLAGSGTPFGGMGKPAGLNGYPGPRRVLDAAKAGELELTTEQQKKIESLYQGMRYEAIQLGKQIIDIEKDIDDAFSSGTMTKELLRKKVSESAGLYGQLRFVHLKYHLIMIYILTPQQVERYNELRGYTSTDPCKNIPEGHDPETYGFSVSRSWKG